MKYAPLFRLDLVHAFYLKMDGQDGRCPDFMITPVQDTQRMLGKYQCMVRARPSGILIIAAVDDQAQPRIPLSEDAVFRFHLRLQNADFALFTDLSDLADKLAPLYTNATLNSGEGALGLTSRTARHTERFVVADPALEERFVLGGMPLEAPAFEVTGAVSQIDVYDPARRVITVNTQAADGGEAFTVSYAVRPRREAGVFAEVEIHNNASLSQPADDPAVFTLTFAPKKAYWAYYFVTNRNDDPALFQIQDTDAEPISFGAETRTDLNDNPDSDDALAVMLAEQYPDMKRIRFISDAVVVCKQQARKNLRLTLNGEEDTKKDDKKGAEDTMGDTLIHPLPNPSFRNPTRLNGSRQPPESLVEVIKYITHSFPTSNT